jgi:hypothetical protein
MRGIPILQELFSRKGFGIFIPLLRRFTGHRQHGQSQMLIYEKICESQHPKR